MKHIFACPKCKEELEHSREYFICNNCTEKFMIKENIPLFILPGFKKNTPFDFEKYYDKSYDKPVDFKKIKQIKKSLPSKSLKFDLVRNFVKNYKQKGILLSIGCGIGDYEELFSSSNYKLFGTDISFNALKHAKKYCKDCIYFQSYAEQLPIKDKSVDIVLCMDVIEHVSNDMHLLDEIKRILKPGGIFILETSFSGKYETYFKENPILALGEKKVITGFGEGGDLRSYGKCLLDELRKRDLNPLQVKYIFGPLSKLTVKFKNYILKKKNITRKDIVSGRLLRENKNYSFYSRILKFLHKLDFLIFNRIYSLNKIIFIVGENDTKKSI